MHNIILTYNLNIIDNHSYIYIYIYINSLKSFLRILLGKKCKLSIFLKNFMFINSKFVSFCMQ